MSQNAVLASQGDFPPESTSRTVPLPGPLSGPSSVPTGDVDPVQALTEAMRRSRAFSEINGESRRRPFDAQYWACWLVALVWPALMVYLLITH